MEKHITIIDSTLRDGSHAMRQAFTTQIITSYAKGAEKARLPILMVGHGNGLGASSLQLGQSLLTDRQMLVTAKRQLTKTKLGAFLIPGYGTIHDDIAPAIDLGIDVLMVACHCTEAYVTQQHLEYAKNHGIVTYGVLMMSHMVSPDILLEQAKLMESYGTTGILLMDSAGAYLPKDVHLKVGLLTKHLNCVIGFHAHNNLGLAVANSLEAVESGATMIDCTSKGLGAGAGNCQLEVIVCVLERMGYHTDLDIFRLMDNADMIISPIMKTPQEINSVTLTSGLAGVFSGFAPHAIRAAEQFEVDVRDILFELGKRKVVAGQEDIIIDVALQLQRKRKTDRKRS